MLYRKLGKSGLDVSILGLGCMRLPLQGGYRSGADGFDPTRMIDEEELTRMVDYAVREGINYFDTAYFYHTGKSEVALGKVLKKYRDRVMIATKLPMILLQKQEEMERFLDEQLKRLDTGYVDLYLLHGLDRQLWPKVKELEVFKFLDQIRKDGRVRHAGFSFHDDIKIFKEIVDCYDWTMCQIQYNYYDEHYQAGKEGLAYAASKGLGVVIMEPLRGGFLANPIPDEVQALWNSSEKQRTPVEWGLRWVWNHPEVSLALSGMSNLEQLKENIDIAKEGKPRSLSEKEISLITQVKNVYKKMFKVGCTGCAYCMPCPNDVNIPINFSIYNDLSVFKNEHLSSVRYNMMLSPEARASNCKECGECEEKCPQHISIMEELKKVHQELSKLTFPPKHA